MENRGEVCNRSSLALEEFVCPSAKKRNPLRAWHTGMRRLNKHQGNQGGYFFPSIFVCVHVEAWGWCPDLSSLLVSIHWGKKSESNPEQTDLASQLALGILCLPCEVEIATFIITGLSPLPQITRGLKSKLKWKLKIGKTMKTSVALTV